MNLRPLLEPFALFVADRSKLLALPISGGHVRPAYHDLAVLIEFHFAAREDFADGSLTDRFVERLVRIDHASHVALVAHPEGEDDEPPIVADARYVRSGDDSAEFAIAVDEIGWQVGYEDAAFFRRLFKRMTGLPPGTYRRRFQIPDFATTSPPASDGNAALT